MLTHRGSDGITSNNFKEISFSIHVKYNNRPIIVFDMNTEGNLLKIVAGDAIGTTVS